MIGVCAVVLACSAIVGVDRNDGHYIGVLGRQRDDAIVARPDLRRTPSERLVRTAEPHGADARHLQLPLLHLLLIRPQRLLAVPEMDVRVEERRSSLRDNGCRNGQNHHATAC